MFIHLLSEFIVFTRVFFSNFIMSKSILLLSTEGRTEGKQRGDEASVEDEGWAHCFHSQEWRQEEGKKEWKLLGQMWNSLQSSELLQAEQDWQPSAFHQNITMWLLGLIANQYSRAKWQFNSFSLSKTTSAGLHTLRNQFKMGRNNFLLYRET